MGKLNCWSIYIINYYFSTVITWNTQQHLKEDLLTLSRCFTFFLCHHFLFYYLFSNSYVQRNMMPIIYVAYRILLSFCYVMYYLVSEAYIGGQFLEECFHCYSQQILSGVLNESLISYNLITRATEKHPLIL